MKNKLLFYIGALLLLGIAVVHALALQGDLYWFYPLLNRAIHFAGGVWIAFASVWLFAQLGRPGGIFRVLTAVILVSIAWEIFEVAIGMTTEKNYVFDTSLDLIMDVSGGILGFLAARAMVQSAHNGENEDHSS
jgi:hypothetical protein